MTEYPLAVCHKPKPVHFRTGFFVFLKNLQKRDDKQAKLLYNIISAAHCLKITLKGDDK